LVLAAAIARVLAVAIGDFSIDGSFLFSRILFFYVIAGWGGIDIPESL